MKPSVVVACALMLTGCKSKLEKCNNVCFELNKEELAACSGDACRREANEKLDACKDLCATVAGPRPAPPDATQLAKACEGGDAKKCEDLGGLFLLGRGGMVKDEAKARTLFAKACELGNIASCEFAGKMMRDGRGGPADDAGATRLLVRACDGASYGACTSLALAAMKSGDKATALRLMTKACDGGDKLGCMGLGAMYLNGNGVKRDRARAKVLLQKACSLGATAACDKARTL
jgi:hypothetical protein